jgi:hypothetical protein
MYASYSTGHDYLLIWSRRTRCFLLGGARSGDDNPPPLRSLLHQVRNGG